MATNSAVIIKNYVKFWC